MPQPPLEERAKTVPPPLKERGQGEGEQVEEQEGETVQVEAREGERVQAKGPIEVRVSSSRLTRRPPSRQRQHHTATPATAMGKGAPPLLL